MVERNRPTTSGESPLKEARRARNATLEQIVAELDARATNGRSGVTPGMLSGWERGRRVTSPPYRVLLCDFYGRSPGVLFAHQDRALSMVGEKPHLLAGFEELASALLTVVRGAEEVLVVTGSRSRDMPYLAEIERQLTRRPKLVHYRVLFGPPHHPVLVEHLSRLLTIRDPRDRSIGYKTLHVGLVNDVVRSPERFVCASERAAVTPIPSLTSAQAFDSGVRLGPAAAQRLVDHVRQCYSGAQPIETHADLEALSIEQQTDPIGTRGSESPT
jgi:transcriptional regulator with XRE-family HTH domain